MNCISLLAFLALMGLTQGKKSTLIPNCIQRGDDIQGSITCVSCKPGYTLSNNKTSCNSCHSKCKTCSNENICLECKMGYYVYANECHKCSLHCVKCEHSGCKDCMYGFSVDQHGMCIRCPNYCKNCTSTTNCTECSTTYSLEVLPVKDEAQNKENLLDKRQYKTECRPTASTYAMYVLIWVILLICIPFMVFCTLYPAIKKVCWKKDSFRQIWNYQNEEDILYNSQNYLGSYEKSQKAGNYGLYGQDPQLSPNYGSPPSNPQYQSLGPIQTHKAVSTFLPVDLAAHNFESPRSPRDVVDKTGIKGSFRGSPPGRHWMPGASPHARVSVVQKKKKKKGFEQLIELHDADANTNNNPFNLIANTNQPF